jgi:hypothetical protein
MWTFSKFISMLRWDVCVLDWAASEKVSGVLWRGTEEGRKQKAIATELNYC